MKHIQMIKTAIVALAIGGALVSKAGTRQVQTRFTLSSTPGSPCDVESHRCGTSGPNCTAPTDDPTVIKTYYHANSSTQCNIPLQQN